MADTEKKPRAAAKPRRTATKKIALVAPPPTMPSHEEIQKLAQAYWAQRGYQDGYAEQDWLRAEQELMARAS